MVGEEENRREPALWDGGVTEKELDISSELPPPKVLLSRKATLPWVYAALAAALMTFVALLIYSMTDLPNQWGFHFGVWARKGPLRIPVLVCGLSMFVLDRIVHGVPIGDRRMRMLPDVLAYYPRTIGEAGRTFLALLGIAMTLAVIYLGQFYLRGNRRYLS